MITWFSVASMYAMKNDNFYNSIFLIHNAILSEKDWKLKIYTEF